MSSEKDQQRRDLTPLAETGADVLVDLFIERSVPTGPAMETASVHIEGFRP
jgi:hypothetical protein